jgi:hypothetical protein
VRKLPRLGVICTICVLGANGSIGQEDQQESSKIVLPEYRFLDLGVTTQWEADRDGKIKKVTVIEVLTRSSAWDTGLRPGDSLQAINHRPVAGMPRRDYLAAIDAPLTPGAPRVYTFSMTRGFAIVTTSTFDLKVEINPRLTGAPAKLRDSKP